MKLKIIANSIHPKNINVINAETGELLEGIRSIEWKVSLSEIATCKIELIGVPVEVVGELVEVTQPEDKAKRFKT